MAKKQNKKKSPSREKYEESHPTVSARVLKETRDKLHANLAKLGMTLPQALMVLAGELEIKTKPIHEARHEGFEEAKKLYMVTYSCPICRSPVPIISPSAKEAAGKYMAERWPGHPECYQKRIQSRSV